MPDALRTSLSHVLVQAVEKAGRALVRDFGEVEQLQISLKGPKDFVTNADRKAEKIILAHLTKARPDFAIIAEESAPNETLKSPCWIVDPIDGTSNFLHGLPFWCITAAAYEKGHIQAAATYNPISRELFWADRGRGAYLGNHRLFVSARRRLDESLVLTDQPHHNLDDPKAFLRLCAGVAGVRRTGSSALDMAFFAAGRVDGLWQGHAQIWDRAAGILLAQEAGAVVTSDDGRGDPLIKPGLIAANPDLIDPLARLLAGDHPKDRPENRHA
ncbi:MAG: inositol monophosphatase family protein [Pseudomonadota bacterium]